jgi:hypothetical protein
LLWGLEFIVDESLFIIVISWGGRGVDTVETTKIKLCHHSKHKAHRLLIHFVFNLYMDI